MNIKKRANKILILMAVAVIVFSFSSVKTANADPFTAGSLRLSVSGGGGHAYGDDYLVVGAGVGFYFRDGLEAGVDFDAWFNGDKDIYTISPQVRYVFHKVSRVKPYAGAFYRHTFIEDTDDVDSIGLRGGAYFMMGRSSYLGVGVVYDNYLDCDKDVYSSCDDLYPEVVLSVAF